MKSEKFVAGRAVWLVALGTVQFFGVRVSNASSRPFATSLNATNRILLEMVGKENLKIKCVIDRYSLSLLIYKSTLSVFS